MKAKVLKQFRDKQTGIIHKPNEIVEVSEKRFNEILKVAPLIQSMEVAVEEVVEETTEEKPKKATKKKK